MSSRNPSRPTLGSQNPRLVASGPTFDATLLAEVSRVQHDKTLQAVRDLIDGIATSDYDKSRGYGTVDRTANKFKADLLAGIRRLRDEASE